MLNFHDRELFWIAVDVANTFGNDKINFEDRCNFVESNLDNLESMQNQAESPWEYRNSVKALRNKLANKDVIHMVYLDASNQALQLYAILTGDKQTASTCNIANGDKMADAYQMLANGMNKLQNKIVLTRSNCKKALMTTMYGKADGSSEILNHLYPSEKDSNVRIQRFCNDYGFTSVEGEHGLELPDFTEIFRCALLDIAPKAVKTMEALTELNATLALPTYRWTMADGFKVKYDVKLEYNLEIEPVMSKKGFKITLPNMNIITYGSNEASRGMSPNVVHSIDGYVAREMIRRMGDKFITTIHDAFACHPRDCDLMVQNYKDILCDILSSDMLQDIMSEISGMDISVVKTNDLSCDDIQQSVYLLA